MSGRRRVMANKKLFKIALVRRELTKGAFEPSKRNIYVFDTLATSAERAIRHAHFKGWGYRPLVDVVLDHEHRIWDTLEVWDGKEVTGINGELLK